MSHEISRFILSVPTNDVTRDGRDVVWHFVASLRPLTIIDDYVDAEERVTGGGGA